MEYDQHNELAQSFIDDVGDDLTYTSVYEDIRSARYEEDDQLSQGVWEHEVTRADWHKVKNLCINAIKNRSKDLQIVGWLVESLTMLDGFYGVATGIEFLTKFIDKYWNICYPHTTNGKSDVDRKIRILDWIYDTIHQRVILLPIINFSLYNYEYARNLKMTILQNPTQATTLVDTAKNNNIKTIEEINNIINSADRQTCKNILQQTETIIKNTDNLSTVLKEKNVTENVFKLLLNDISTIRYLFRNTVSNNTDNTDAPNVTSQNIPALDISKCDNNEFIKIEQILNRDNLYSSLNTLAEQLEKFDKHSPAPYLLKLIVSWKDKNLLEIMNDLQQGETSAHLLLRRLLS